MQKLSVSKLEEYSKCRIQRNFFLTDAVDLAKKLLGKIIVRKFGESKYVTCRIVETEAYMGELDKGSHVHKYKMRERTKPFWNEGGHLYVYLIYGLNHCMNIIANDEQTPQGVLIRAVEPLEGVEEMIKNRCLPDLNSKSGRNSAKFVNLTNGPGKVSAALKIDRTYNSVDLTISDEIFLVDDSEFKYTLSTSARVNIDYAKDYIDKPWRFYIKDNKFVSKVSSKIKQF